VFIAKFRLDSGHGKVKRTHQFNYQGFLIFLDGFLCAIPPIWTPSRTLGRFQDTRISICQLGFFEDMVPQNQICHNLPMTMTITVRYAVYHMFGHNHIGQRPGDRCLWSYPRMALKTIGLNLDEGIIERVDSKTSVSVCVVFWWLEVYMVRFLSRMLECQHIQVVCWVETILQSFNSFSLQLSGSASSLCDRA
jgi:hypothetical protein